MMKHFLEPSDDDEMESLVEQVKNRTGMRFLRTHYRSVPFWEQGIKFSEETQIELLLV